MSLTLTLPLDVPVRPMDAKGLSNSSRYIDDIGVCNMNNNNDFICSKDIYPESILLTAGCIENHKDTFFRFRYYYKGE